MAVGLGFRFTRRNPVWPGSVSCSRSSNRTGGVTASGSRKRLTWLRVTPSATSEHKTGVARLVVNPRVLRRFLRPSLTEVPSLRRSYPASSVVRTSPPPQTARPGSRELPVDPDCDHRWGFPCCVWSPVSACRRHYPRQVRWNRFARTLPSTSAFPRLQMGRHLHYQFRGLLSVHSCYNLQTCRVALCDPLHQRLQRLRCLHRCSDCYRAERSSSRAGLSSRCGPAPFTAH